MRFTFMEFSIGEAARLLEEHDAAVASGLIANRARAPMRVRRIADDLAAGRWFPATGETVKFTESTNGNELHGRDLVDGQTRLAACVMAGKSLGVYVATGVDRGAFVYLDSGAKRTVRDVLDINRESNAEIVAPAIRWITIWDFDRETMAVRTRGSMFGKLTNRQALDVLQRHPDLRRSASIVAELPTVVVGRGMSAFLHYVFARKDAPLAERFIAAVGSGENFAENHPFLTWRNRMFSSHLPASRLPATSVVAMAIKAWNAARRDESLSPYQLRYRPKIDDFPTLQ